jgi:hypothetical protein
MRKKYISIQFLNTGAKLLATRGNNNNNKYCKWGHFVVSPDFNSVQ